MKNAFGGLLNTGDTIHSVIHETLLDLLNIQGDSTGIFVVMDGDHHQRSWPADDDTRRKDYMLASADSVAIDAWRKDEFDR